MCGRVCVWGGYDSNSTNSVVTERAVEVVVSMAAAPIGALHYECGYDDYVQA